MRSAHPWLLLGLASCGGAPAAAPAPSATAGDERVAATSSSAAESGGSVFFGRWLRVTSVRGNGLAVGSLVRFGDGTFEACSGRLAQSMPVTCDASAPQTPSSCELAGLSVRVSVLEDGVVLDGGEALSLSLEPASASDGAACEAQVVGERTRSSTCRAAAECCMAAEPTLGGCDLNAVLGDRSLSSCEAARARVRASLDERGVAVPDACR